MNEPIRDLHAEANALAALLQDGKQLEPVLDVLGIDDFYEPRAQLLFGSMVRIHTRGEPVDPRRVSDDLTRQGELAQVAADGWLPNLLTRDHVIPLQATYYAGQVLRASRRRQLQQLATSVHQRTEDEDANPDEILDWIEDQSRRMRQQLMAIDGPIDSITDLIHRDNTLQWVVPGVIAQHDRIILVGHEGHGKSVLTSQIGASAAAGLNPFTFRPCDPARVLIVDCENDPDSVSRRLDSFSTLSTRYGKRLDETLTYVERPGGLELSRGSDASWLSRLVSRVRPQLVVIGPLYRLTESDLAKEEASRGVIAALDRVRLRGDCALLMEAHVGNEGHDGNRPYRPYGASIWRRWAGIGMSMKPVNGVNPKEKVYRLADYRGKRSAREWPEFIGWAKESNQWPWQPVSSDWVAHLRQEKSMGLAS